MHLSIDVGRPGHPAWEQHSAATGGVAAEAAGVFGGVVNKTIAVVDDLAAGGVVKLVGTQDSAVSVVSAVRSVDSVGLHGPVVIVGTGVLVGTDSGVGCGLCKILPEGVWPHRRGGDLCEGE